MLEWVLPTRPQFQKLRQTSGLLLGFILGVMALRLLLIPVQLAIALHQAPAPQAILVLGGPADRELFTAAFASQVPDLPIWVSSGMSPEVGYPVFQAAGIADQRVHFDRRATDTVTNFTTMVDVFQKRRIHHVYLVTSDFHMNRSRAIASLVFGSRGIWTTPVVVPSDYPPESAMHVLRDILRSIFWIFTRHSGARLRFLLE